MQFQFPLRRYQTEILGLVDQKLAKGENRMHIVAPPGAGKTILGLQIISQFKRPSLVLCPNTTIQSQWGQKVDLFLPPDQKQFGTSDLIGTHDDKPLKPITLLTYQVLSTPGREQEYLEKLAHDAWISELTAGRAISVGEAELRILDLLRNNPKAHAREISRHVSRLRKRLTEVLDLKDVLHPNALQLLQSLRRQKFGVVIFDECHHLTDYWAAIMTHLVKVLDDPILIGLTGTPPEGKSTTQETRYLSLVGQIDYQVPTPALVKEGGLAPFQDLAYFTEPTDRELQFLEEQHLEFHELVDELIAPVPIPIEEGSDQTGNRNVLTDGAAPLSPRSGEVGGFSANASAGRQKQSAASAQALQQSSSTETVGDIHPSFTKRSLTADEVTDSADVDFDLFEVSDAHGSAAGKKTSAVSRRHAQSSAGGARQISAHELGSAIDKVDVEHLTVGGTGAITFQSNDLDHSQVFEESDDSSISPELYDSADQPQIPSSDLSIPANASTEIDGVKQLQLFDVGDPLAGDVTSEFAEDRIPPVSGTVRVSPSKLVSADIAPFGNIVSPDAVILPGAVDSDGSIRKFTGILVEPTVVTRGLDETELAKQGLQNSNLTMWVRNRVFNAVQKDVVRFQRLNGAQITAQKTAARTKRTKSGDAIATVKTAKIVTTAKGAVSTDKESKTARKPTAAEKAAATKPYVPPGGWTEIMQSQPELAQAFCRYLWKLNVRLPRNIEPSEALMQSPTIDDWMRVLDDYAAHKLKVSADKEEHKLYDRIRGAARKLGYGMTEQGLRKQASPVDRVLAFSGSKPLAVAEILRNEYRVLQDRLRAVVVTDFETMSATSVKSLKGVLSEESGGAVMCIKILLKHDISNYLNPCLVTGSLLLIDKRVVDQFARAAEEYLKKEGFNFKLTVDRGDEETPYCKIYSTSGDWQSKLYVGLATAIFERGITKCLIGTRGLFGEGWDSQALNTLIDLTTTTSPVSVKQLRGRSIRIQTNDPLGARKVANNWDVVCIAPQLSKGLNDYQRFAKKHDCFFGVADDGHIERGVGHVHPSFTELTPIEVFASYERFNDEMIERSIHREDIYDLWKVGQPYKNRMLGCIEVTGMRKLALTPPHIRRDLKYREHARELNANFVGIWAEYLGLAVVLSASIMLFCGFLAFAQPFAACSVLAGMAYLARKKCNWLFDKLRREVCRPNTQDSSLWDIGTAVLTALQRRKFIPLSVKREQIKISTRSDGTYRVFLDGLEPEQSEIFVSSFKEAIAPVVGQPYLIPKYEYFIAAPGEAAPDTNEQDKYPDYVRREREFFKSYLKGKAAPRVAAYHAVPSLLARSEKGREAFEAAWNKYVSPGFIVNTETNSDIIDKYFGLGPSLAQRVLWE